MQPVQSKLKPIGERAPFERDASEILSNPLKFCQIIRVPYGLRKTVHRLDTHQLIWRQVIGSRLVNRR